jgi:hypothetical protein
MIHCSGVVELQPIGKSLCVLGSFLWFNKRRAAPGQLSMRSASLFFAPPQEFTVGAVGGGGGGVVGSKGNARQTASLIRGCHLLYACTAQPWQFATTDYTVGKF